MFQGSITALITPFRNGEVDEATFQALVERQVEEGSDGLVPCGTTGEAPTLTKAEQGRLIAICREVAGDKIPVIAGCGTNSTAKTIDLARQAEQRGADALLVVVPYYNKPSQEGLFLHFQAVAKATALPVIIYNIPGRSAADMTVDTMVRLKDACENIVGVKDATANIDRAKEQRKALGKKFCMLSGDDFTALDFAQAGGNGCISVTSNIAPRLCAAFQKACREGDFKAAREVHEKLIPLHRNLFVESNPVPVKYAASLLGLCPADVRLPLALLTKESREKVETALRKTGILDD